MKNKIRYLGLLAILPLFTAALAITAHAESSDPLIELVDVKPFIGGQTSEYLATFKVHVGDDSVQNVHVFVKSDQDSFEKKVLGGSKADTRNEGFIDAHSYAVSTVKIKASDPGSIEIGLLSYQIRG